jgi:hypothetical protein
LKWERKYGFGEKQFNFLVGRRKRRGAGAGAIGEAVGGSTSSGATTDLLREYSVDTLLQAPQAVRGLVIA